MTKYRNQKNRKTIIVYNNLEHPESNQLDLRYQGCITNFWYSLSKQHPITERGNTERRLESMRPTLPTPPFPFSRLSSLPSVQMTQAFGSSVFSFRARILSTFFHRQLLMIQQAARPEEGARKVKPKLERLLAS